MGGALWSVIADALTRATAFAVTVLLARLLGVSDYGRLGLLQTTLQAFSVFATLGLGLTSTRFIACYKVGEPQRAGRVALLALLIGVSFSALATLALWVSAGPLAAIFLELPELALHLRLIAPALVFIGLGGICRAILQGLETFRVIAWLELTVGLCSLTLLVPLVRHLGLTGAVLALVATEVLRALLYASLTARALTRAKIPMGLRGCRGELRVLWRFSLPTALAHALHIPVLWICQSVIAHQPNGTAALGAFFAAQRWLTLVTSLPLAASAAFLPLLSQRANRLGARLTWQLAAIQFSVTIIPAVAVFAAIPSLMPLFGKGFANADANDAVRVLMLLAPGLVVSGVIWQDLVGRGIAWTLLSTTTLWALTMYLTTWLLRDAGALALACAMLAGYGVQLLANTLIVLILQWSSSTAFRSVRNDKLL
ncbi:hypothetical protein THSYN_02425 [Candidatus Thiodictyon syntrophicum]|jgi:O-antigen/teichoic acid export membrane protein|uniref:Polysaccharide biosynthesis protein C-terminal domain-containing protein n=2 Tax=Candidatus Thiodictyon syntrophicum TaxID=1166950 RepID=A0A2K8U2X1_9GAMM|nr:hypothetical protein THSYN_02425 [Candidatus Thiodictyon syntrophicum]